MEYLPLYKIITTRSNIREIASNRRKEHYLPVTPYWMKMLKNMKFNIKGESFIPHKIGIYFYSRTKEGLIHTTAECTGLMIGSGKLKWGAEIGREYFIISLGRVFTPSTLL